MRGCIVSTNPQHYTGGGVITATRADGLRITGTGNIGGRAREFMSSYDKPNEWWLPSGFRPKMFVLTACKGLEVHDITFSEAPEWGLHMIGCEHVLVDNLKIRNLLDVPNCDGIDPDHCRDVEIRNCNIVCGDDAIVIKATRQATDYGPSANITVHDCVIQTQDAGVKIGTETTQDIHDIRFERCEIRSSSRGLSLCRQRGPEALQRQVGRQAPGLLHARPGSRSRNRVGTHGVRRRGRASGAGRRRGRSLGGGAAEESMQEENACQPHDSHD
jgi:polygalacturonase